MENKELLNEEKFQKVNKKVSISAFIVLFIGLILGGTLIVLGITKVSKNNKKYSEEERQKNISEITIKLNEEKEVLDTKKQELINKGVKESFDYNNTEGYELYMLNEALDPGDSTCFMQSKNYPITENYCNLKDKLDEIKRMDLDFEKSFNGSKNIVFFMFGGFIIFASLLISSSIFRISKRREILAYGTQQAMPVVKESAEKMAPTIGVIAKEVVKGINEAKDEKITCSECGKEIKKDAKFCENCGKKI